MLYLSISWGLDQWMGAHIVPSGSELELRLGPKVLACLGRQEKVFVLCFKPVW